MTIHRAIVPVTPELLREALGFPNTAEVLGVIDRPDFQLIHLILEDPALPEVKHGAVLPVASPLFRSAVPVHLKEWGLDGAATPLGVTPDPLSPDRISAIAYLAIKEADLNDPDDCRAHIEAALREATDIDGRRALREASADLDDPA